MQRLCLAEVIQWPIIQNCLYRPESYIYVNCYVRNWFRSCDFNFERGDREREILLLTCLVLVLKTPLGFSFTVAVYSYSSTHDLDCRTGIKNGRKFVCLNQGSNQQPPNPQPGALTTGAEFDVLYLQSRLNGPVYGLDPQKSTYTHSPWWFKKPSHN